MTVRHIPSGRAAKGTLARLPPLASANPCWPCDANTGNEAHVYEYVEALIRCAHRVYRSNNVQRNAHSSLSGCLRSMLADHILPRSCSHDSVGG